MVKKAPTLRKAFIVGVIATIIVTLMLFILGVLEGIAQHALASAAFAATALIVVLQPTSDTARPLTIAVGYIFAASVGFIVSLFMLPLEVSAGLVVGISAAGLLLLKRMHIPAVAYGFAFVLSGYGFVELALTVPALLGFFMAIGVAAFVVEEITYFIGLARRPRRRKPRTALEHVERFVDTIVPYALVLLFVMVIAEFSAPEALTVYKLVFEIIDWMIIGLFVLDLYFKYRHVSSNAEFLRLYWVDIIATIPFFVFLRAFEGVAILLRLGTVAGDVSQVSRLSRTLRPIARFPRFARMLENLEKKLS